MPEDRVRSPRRRPRSPAADDEQEQQPAKTRRKHEVKGEHRHHGHGDSDHADDHRIQNEDEAALAEATAAAREAADRATKHRSSSRSRSQDRQDDGRRHASAADGGRSDRRHEDRYESSRQRDRAADDRRYSSRWDDSREGHREKDGAGRQEPAGDTGNEPSGRAVAAAANGGIDHDKQQTAAGPGDGIIVRKGRGFKDGNRRSSRSRSRERYHSDRGGRDSRYGGRYDDRYGSRHDRYDSGIDRHGRDSRGDRYDRDNRGDRHEEDSRRDGYRDSRGRNDRGGADRAGRSSRDGMEQRKSDREAATGAPEQPLAAATARAAVERADGQPVPAAAANGGAAAGGDEKDAADFLKKKAAMTGRAGGAYIPPFRLARMMAEIDDKNSTAAQKLSWEALRKSLNGLINKVNAPNIKELLPELFQENLLRGRGLFCQAIMKAQLASPTFSPLYAALVSVVNTKFLELGELLLHRVIAQFKRAYKRNDKPITIAAAKFLAHLINQGVVHEVLALEMLILLLENPSDDSVEMAVDFCKEVGAYLQDVAPAGLHSVFERFRAILHEGAIDKRCQYMIEGLFAVRKAGFAASGYPAVKPELDLVEDEDQITHEMSLDDKHDPQAVLNVFREDPEYELHEQQYKAIVKEVLGDDEEEEEAGGEHASNDGSEEEEPDEEQQQQDIEDATGTDVVNLRRTIYLTIMSSLDFEEAGHKLMKIQLAPGQEGEIPIMIIECCSQEKTFVRYYALLGARFCHIKKEFQATFEDCFAKQYAIIHRLETNKLRNVAKLFAHLLASDAISWGVLGCIRLTEDDTTSSSRIFIKYLFQELSEYLGVVKLNERLAEPSLQQYFTGIFPTDTMANMRFSINFFTSIGLGGITDRQRELYKQVGDCLWRAIVCWHCCVVMVANMRFIVSAHKYRPGSVAEREREGERERARSLFVSRYGEACSWVLCF
eukprot:GHRR01006471.1.p1 GENE.GHRR01006471.1~~GHRR01006471.1.p1  ORF type:complete len:946 (+),score=354.04 GHRR01006471.1:464-3301(+)